MFRALLVAAVFSSTVSAQADGGVPLRADLHVHLVMHHAAAPLMHGEPGDGTLASAPGHRLLNQVDAQALRRAGVRVLFGAVWAPFRARPPLRAPDLALRELELLQTFALRRPDFAVVGDVASARRQLALGRLVVFPQLEGAEGLEQASDVDRFFAAGVRVVTLVHFIDTQLGGAARGQFERSFLGHPADGALNPQGLTPLGRAVVERMFALGMLVDLAHASDALAGEVLTLAEARGVPVVVSHGGARSLLPIERNVSDAIARRVADGGGLIGVTLFDGQLSTPRPHPLDGGQPGTCDDAIAHWLQLARVAGASRLVLGSDLNGFITRPGPGGRCPGGVRGSQDLAMFFETLTAAGVPGEALDQTGEQVLQLMERVEHAADPDARRAALRSPPTPPVRPFDAP